MVDQDLGHLAFRPDIGDPDVSLPWIDFLTIWDDVLQTSSASDEPDFGGFRNIGGARKKTTEFTQCYVLKFIFPKEVR